MAKCDDCREPGRPQILTQVAGMNLPEQRCESCGATLN